MALRDLVLSNRSTRAYDRSRKVTREEIVSLIDLARLSPSANNRQPLRYYIACDDESAAKVFSHTHWAGLLKGIKLPPEGKEPPAFIAIYVDKDICPNADAAGKDVGIAAQTILLGAAELGLSGCMIGAFDRPGTQNDIGLPEKYELTLLIALGRRDEDIRLTETDGPTAYYRGEDGTHYVPKLKMENILLN